MQILPAESLRPYNSLSLEASAAALALVDTDQELSKALDWSRAQGLAVLPLGQGSNVVIVDDLEIIPISSFEEEIIAIEDLDVLVVEGDGVELVTSNW